MSFISEDSISEIFINCLKSRFIHYENDTTVIFYDFNQLANRITTLKAAFPDNTMHTVAIKANPLIKVLQEIQKKGLGVEAASEGELFIAQKTGFNSKQIVFDSPAKTKNEILYAIENGIHINADSTMELERIADMEKKINPAGKIGLRINPQVGYGTIEATSVAGEYSKFGIPVKSHRKEIIESFLKYKWLSGIHIHIGSQGCSMKMLLDGFEEILKLSVDIHQQTKNKIQFIDIGGGIPVSYHHDQNPPDIAEYGSEIQSLLNKYQLENLQLITEFGRYLHANSGFTISRVEYVKHYIEKNTLIIHAGADLFLRECLNPGQWFHEFTLLDKNGKIKHSDNKLKYHIAGPLCFAGDIVARDVELPRAEEGDYLVIHDTGAYTFGMWSKYVSRLFPKIIGITGNSYKVIRKRETSDEIYKYWTD
ncbi:MAG TPA: diaminopimelate decarboxylase [Bacteroidales bacterium]|nr:diaminopimelate decarboxylase [Bacteroidales bacterium]